MDKSLNKLIDELKKILEERLLSILLYGSSVTEENTSDINLIIVVDKITAVDLKAVYPAVKKWVKTKNPPPLFMGNLEWFGSCDTYPMEYADIKQRHKLLYGEDIVSQLSIKKGHLRLQCESETKNLLIKLRQNYLLKNNDKNEITELIKYGSKSFMAIFRTILRLQGDFVPENKNEVISLISQRININEEIFKKILLFRKNKKIFDKNELENIIQILIDSIYEVLKYVDQMQINKEEQL
ncbi:MAG: hypothetical protein ACOCV1_07070 [Bacillota bacterium]